MPIRESEYVIEGNAADTYHSLDKKLLGSDVILLLLSFGKIKGDTVLQKQVFLTWKEVFPEQMVDLGYFPYRFGAYSRIIHDAGKELENEHLISKIKRKGEGSIYEITDKGLLNISSKLQYLNIDIEKLQKRKENWDEWDKDGILVYVYRNYPEYTTETKLKRFKWQ